MKRVEQQTLVALHRVREQWMTTRTARINTLRGILREQGSCCPRARGPPCARFRRPEDAEAPLPTLCARCCASVHEEMRELEAPRRPRSSESCVRWPTPIRSSRGCVRFPGIGLLTATALVGTVGHIHAFRRARQFASWLGLTPREYSSGARRRLGGISKRGDVYLRCLLTHGARAVLLAAHVAAATPRADDAPSAMGADRSERRGHNKATIAVANKLGRIVWAVWHKDVPVRRTVTVPRRPCAGRSEWAACSATW